MILGYLENLTDFGPRPTGSPACQQAGKYIYQEFKDMGLQVRYHNWSYSGHQGSNIEGTIPGNNPYSDEIYIVCGHYDTVSSSPGADDDASGVVTAMAAANIFRNYAFNHTVRFVAFSGEELGLLGSHEYVVEAYNNGDNIVGVLNVDMIGYAETVNDGKNIKIYANSASQWLFDYTEDISDQYTTYIDLNLIHSGTSSGSDHYYFWQYGYDALFYHEYHFNPYYHSSQDTIANMNVTYNTKCAKLIIATLADLAGVNALSTPPYPPTITGPNTGIVGAEYIFTFHTTDPDGDDIYILVDWDDLTPTDWLGPYTSGTTINIPHTWTQSGIYQITAKAKDEFNSVSDWSTPFTITILNDTAPTEPTISGPGKGIPGETYLYSFQSTDAENHDIYYYIDWGDGTSTEWDGPYNSGQIAGISHIWEEKGTYTIQAKAKDSYGVESEWTTLDVTMPRTTTTLLTQLQNLINLLIQRFPLLTYLQNLIHQF